jgi:DNA-binding transcriptional ArsR family regulator
MPAQSRPSPAILDMLEHADEASRFLKLIANRSRLMIVCALVEGERAVGALETELRLEQPALSQQIAALRRAGIIMGRREAKAVFYRLADARAVELVGLLHRLFCADGRQTA